MDMNRFEEPKPGAGFGSPAHTMIYLNNAVVVPAVPSQQLDYIHLYVAHTYYL